MILYDISNCLTNAAVAAAADRPPLVITTRNEARVRARVSRTVGSGSVRVRNFMGRRFLNQMQTWRVSVRGDSLVHTFAHSAREQSRWCEWGARLPMAPFSHDCRNNSAGTVLYSTIRAGDATVFVVWSRALRARRGTSGRVG